jgi:hypothetical protein
MTFTVTKSLVLNNTSLIVLTQLVLWLYGAGLRRPFGSLDTVSVLPHWLKYADRFVLAADIVFAIFVVAMWGIIFWINSFWYAAALGFFAYLIGLVPSFFIAIALSLTCVVLAIFLLEQAGVISLSF